MQMTELIFAQAFSTFGCHGAKQFNDRATGTAIWNIISNKIDLTRDINEIKQVEHKGETINNALQIPNCFNILFSSSSNSNDII